MKRTIALSLFLGGILSSCFFVNDIFEPPPENEETLQQKSEKAVSAYIRKTTHNEIYEPYGFGSITIRKPIEIVELEKLQKKQKSEPSVELDSAIAQKKRFIKQNNIERTLDLDHFFTLKDTTGILKIFETTFILNDTLGVKDLSAKIILYLPEKYEDALTYYFYEYNIFNTPSYYESRNLSNNFYAFFKEELEKRKGRDAKSAFLLHVIKMTQAVKDRGEFKQQEILEENVKEFISTQRTDIKDYEELQFSNLYQTQQDDTAEVNGYYFFHKFIGTFQGELDTNVVLVEFNKFYEIDNIYQMDRPFGAYFNE
ncbi:MAG: hypothetical protein HUJ25_08380 [Crocinitomicaceae bacterium]|nr:hypothetical protein [Crocinitomicaceae bacterium]